MPKLYTYNKYRKMPGYLEVLECSFIVYYLIFRVFFKFLH